MRDVARSPLGDDVLPARLCASLQGAYTRLQPEGRLAFISILARQDVDDAAMHQRCKALLATADEGRGTGATLRAREALREELTPVSQRVVERLAQQRDGLRFLVRMRADLLRALDGASAAKPKNEGTASASGALAAAVSANNPAEKAADAADERERWRALDSSLRRLLSVWFDAGLLELQRLSWEGTSASLLSKLMRYERVHAISGWEDLQRRLDGPGRRLFAFLHPRMPNEPLVFVQCCMLEEIPCKLSQVLQRGDAAGGCSGDDSHKDGRQDDDQRDDEGAASHRIATRRVACFYSISSPFAGLRGVPLGRLLIKQVHD